MNTSRGKRIMLGCLGLSIALFACAGLLVVLFGWPLVQEMLRGVATPTPVPDPLEAYRLAHQPVYLGFVEMLEQQHRDFDSKPVCEWDLRDLGYLVDQLKAITPPPAYQAYHDAFAELLRLWNRQRGLMRAACADPARLDYTADVLPAVVSQGGEAFDRWIAEAQKCGLAEWMFGEEE